MHFRIKDFLVLINAIKISFCHILIVVDLVTKNEGILHTKNSSLMFESIFLFELICSIFAKTLVMCIAHRNSEDYTVLSTFRFKILEAMSFHF